MTASTPAHVRILQAPDCPLVDRLRTSLEDALHQTGQQPVVETLTGSYPSPTLLVDGVDVVTGRPPNGLACCRLDLPTPAQIIAALRKGTMQ